MRFISPDATHQQLADGFTLACPKYDTTDGRPGRTGHALASRAPLSPAEQGSVSGFLLGQCSAQSKLAREPYRYRSEQKSNHELTSRLSPLALNREEGRSKRGQARQARKDPERLRSTLRLHQDRPWLELAITLSHYPQSVRM